MLTAAKYLVEISISGLVDEFIISIFLNGNLQHYYNVFTVILAQFNASFVNKKIYISY